MSGNGKWLGRKDTSLSTVIRCLLLFRGLLYFACVLATFAPSLGGEKAKEPHLVVKENEARGASIKWQIDISQFGAICRHSWPHLTLPPAAILSTLRMSKTQSSITAHSELAPASSTVSVGEASVLCHSDGRLDGFETLCSLSLQLVSHKVLLMSPSTLSPFPTTYQGYCYSLLTVLLPQVSPPFCQPSTSVVLRVVPRPLAPASPGNLLGPQSE